MSSATVHSTDKMDDVPGDGRAPCATHRIRVLVADDHPLVREGLVRALWDDGRFTVLEQAADGRRAVDLVRQLSPDVAVLDVRMPGMDGLHAMAAIREQAPRTRVVLLSAFRDHELVHAARVGGAAAYLTKGTGRDELCEALARVAAGEDVRPYAPDRRAGRDGTTGTTYRGMKHQPDRLDHVRAALRGCDHQR